MTTHNTTDDVITFEGYSYSHERPDIFPYPRMLWKDDSDGNLYYWDEGVKKFHLRGLNDDLLIEDIERLKKKLKKLEYMELIYGIIETWYTSMESQDRKEWVNDNWKSLMISFVDNVEDGLNYTFNSDADSDTDSCTDAWSEADAME